MTIKEKVTVKIKMKMRICDEDEDEDEDEGRYLEDYEYGFEYEYDDGFMEEMGGYPVYDYGILLASATDGTTMRSRASHYDASWVTFRLTFSKHRGKQLLD